MRCLALLATFILCLGLSSEARANDECVDRIAVGVGSTLINTLGATDSGVSASCGLGSDLDLFYEFTAPSAGFLVVAARGLGSPNPTVLSHAVYRDPCSLVVEAGCAQNLGQTILDASSGEVLVIRVFGDSGPGELEIEFFFSSPNDECASATPITHSLSIPTFLATPSTGGTSCGPAGLPDVFLEYTASFSGIVTLRLPNSPPFAYISVFEDCTLTTQLDCFDHGGSTRQVVAPGETLLLQLSTIDPAVVQLLVTEDPFPEGNFCSTREVRIDAGVVSVPLSNATDSGFDASCGNSSHVDRYFGFVFSDNGEVTLQGLTGNLDVSAFIDPTPCDLQNEVGCDASGQPFSFLVNAGEEVVVRVTGNSGGGGLLQVGLVPEPVNDECAGALPVSVGSITLDLEFFSATVPSPPQSCSAPGPSADLFLEYVPPTDGYLYVPTISIPLVQAFEDCTLANELACQVMGESLLVPATSGIPITLRASGSNMDVGAIDLELVDSVFIRGDADGNGVVELADVLIGIQSILAPTPSASCLDAIDVNADATISIADSVDMLRFLFLGGSPPTAPYPDCGPSPTGSNSIGCAGPPPICP